MSDELLGLDDVSVRRSGTWLVTGVDWQVRAGERWVVLGPNGAGKTTLLRLASGYLHPTSGRARLLGHQLGHVDLATLRPRIGFESAAMGELFRRSLPTVDLVVSAKHGATMRFPRHAYTAADERRARSLLDRLGCGALTDRRADTLSQGEWQRAQIARALMTDPELLLLDEPMAGVDLAGREQLVRTLGELAADPETPALVLVTHHLEEIPQGFSHALLLRDGAVVAGGALEDTLTSANVSAAFDVDVVVERAQGRWTARSR